MVKFNYIICILTFALLVGLVSCDTDREKIFAASDELHYVHLYEERNEFEILYNGINKVRGMYKLKGDTILLMYNSKDFDNFTTKLLIDTTNKRVKSIDDKSFCANIYIDNRAVQK
jgi:hypothetical protein